MQAADPWFQKADVEGEGTMVQASYNPSQELVGETQKVGGVRIPGRGAEFSTYPGHPLWQNYSCGALVRT